MTASATLARLRGLSDTLGGIQAEINLLQDKANAIKAELKASGEREIIGKIYVSRVLMTERLSLDTKKAAKLLEENRLDVPMKSSLVVTIVTSEN